MRGKYLAVVAIVLLLSVTSLFTVYSLVYAPSLRAEAGQAILYFANSDASKVVAEKRAVVGEVTPELIVLELIKGPQSAGLWPTLPAGTRLLSLEVGESVAYVNLSQAAKDNHSGGSAAELMLVYSVVASLTELPEITAVQFLLEGEIHESIWGHMDTSQPIPPDESFIAR